MFTSRYMPCPECGDSVERLAAEAHRCDPDRLVSYRMFTLREEIAAFESRLHNYLDTGQGRFERWLAARMIRDATR